MDRVKADRTVFGKRGLMKHYMRLLSEQVLQITAILEHLVGNLLRLPEAFDSDLTEP